MKAITLIVITVAAAIYGNHYFNVIGNILDPNLKYFIS